MTQARLTVLLCAGAASAMLGLAFASKPLYDAFCRVTGFGGTTQRSDVGADAELDRVVTVRFDATTNPALPLVFEPLETAVDLTVGRNALAFYRVTNTSDRPVRAIATYNVTPHKAGPYFVKMECFCFQDQTFAPGASVDLPVVFFIDPAIAEERRLDDLNTVTLSYTFFPSKSGDLAQRNAAAGRDTAGVQGG